MKSTQSEAEAEAEADAAAGPGWTPGMWAGAAGS